MTEHQDNLTEARASELFTSVLVPVDGSEVSERAVAYAAQFDIDRLVLLRVETYDPPDEHEPSTDAYVQWRRGQIANVTESLNELVRTYASAARTVDTVIRYGSPAEEIIVESRNHELVVMSSHGRGAAGRLLLGSVADRVMRFGAAPTLVVRADGQGVSVAPPKRVVVPLDGSELSEKAIPVARRIARSLAAPLYLIRVVGMDEILHRVRAKRAELGRRRLRPPEGDPYEDARQETEAAAMAYLEDHRTRLEADGLEATVEVRGGTPSFELLWAVASDDIVVMTSRGEGGFQRWLVGSVAERMMREAEAPVLLVPIRSPADESVAETRSR